MSNPLSTPILQFGTSRFLQAHADLFISQALSRGQALGKVTVVQTTASPDSARRVQALARGRVIRCGYRAPSRAARSMSNAGPPRLPVR